MTGCATYKIVVEGKVQGVGFRPFIYVLATEMDLKGNVSNNSNSVVITAQGATEQLDKFVETIKERKPPASSISKLDYVQVSNEEQYENFQIIDSQTVSEKGIPVTADLVVCQECLTEMFETSNRRYLYPFINCTNCGPRYSIIHDIPYDRPNTSMSSFKMCDDCRKEYNDPLNRRFHAQPISCWKCGPELRLLNKDFQTVPCDDPIAEAVSYLKQGHIIAVKGIGGYHLIADPLNEASLETLRLRKKRDQKPFALMCYGLEECEEICVVRYTHERELLESIERPIVLLPKRSDHPLPENVAPGNTNFGVMLPYTPIHVLLMKGSFKYLICTSANISDNPIIHNEDSDDYRELTNLCDYVLTHNRGIVNFSDDSIVKCIIEDNSPRHHIIRRSRGYIPDLFEFMHEGPPLLAVGAELKNTVSLTKKNKIFMSQHVGDLKGVGLYSCFVELINNMRTFFDQKPEAVVCDLHPNFINTTFAEKLGIPVLRCQHHHAHMNACMAENSLEGPTIGVVFDGMGFGLDDKIWGGEFLVGDYKSFERCGHFEYFSLPGGDKCNKDISRTLFGLYYSYFQNKDLLLYLNNELFSMQQFEVFEKMVKQNINSPLTSSLGRIFDAVAVLIGLRAHANFEGQAAIELEQLICKSFDGMQHGFYNHSITNAGKLPFQISVKEFLSEIIEDVKTGTPNSLISEKFHNMLINIVVDACRVIRQKHTLNDVTLSGGCFLNTYLLEGCIHQLTKEGFHVYYHQRYPTNDGGISLGQAVHGLSVLGSG